MRYDFENVKTVPLKRLAANQKHDFTLEIDAHEAERIAEALDLISLRKARLTGSLRPSGAQGWVFEAMLGATVQQPCVVTLAPVTTRIDEAVTRHFVSDMPEVPESEDEIEMPEDDTLEPLGTEISLIDVFQEALALALPDYPKADGASLDRAVFTEPGAQPMRDEDAKPFAGLAALKAKLENPKDDG